MIVFVSLTASVDDAIDAGELAVAIRRAADRKLVAEPVAVPQRPGDHLAVAAAVESALAVERLRGRDAE